MKKPFAQYFTNMNYSIHYTGCVFKITKSDFFRNMKAKSNPKQLFIFCCRILGGEWIWKATGYLYVDIVVKYLKNQMTDFAMKEYIQEKSLFIVITANTKQLKNLIYKVIWYAFIQMFSCSRGLPWYNCSLSTFLFYKIFIRIMKCNMLG